MNLFIFLPLGVFLLLAGILLGYFIRQSIARRQADTIEAKIRTLINNAKSQAKEILIEARDRATKIVEEATQEEKERKKQLLYLENRLLRREESLEQKVAQNERKERELRHTAGRLREIKAEIEQLKDQAVKRLESIAQMSQASARQELLRMVEERYRKDLAASIRKLEKDRYQEIERKAVEIMTAAIQRYARSHICDATTCVVSLPNDDIKGRIIGKEGRNIRTLERLTGVEVIVDETPEIITLSSFDPIRREVARVALDKLIKDGRIQPARIEEKVEEARQEVNEQIKEAGEAAVYEVGILDLPKELIYLLGRLSFRTSFGQNVLLHSLEAAHLAGILAAELNLNGDLAKKGALLHDIGKAIDHEISGNHIEIGRKILQKYNIDENVIKAMEAHHESYPFAIPEAFVVAAAEAVSAARPGARRDTLENYLKRLEELEKIATGFDGVEKAYALQAGRELRVFVTPTKIDDFGALNLAREIASKIESELRYPGEIKVNVIRETRAVEYAR